MCDAVGVPLSYSIPSFKASDYDDVAEKLSQLRGFGFRWVTFTPTFQVTESVFDSRSLAPRGKSIEDYIGRFVLSAGRWFLRVAKDIPEEVLILTLDLSATPSFDTIRRAVIDAVT